jgi:DNA repair exonuclease SbcCD nuclease subunit
MVRFIHSSDWQLGMTRHFLSDEAQARYSAARLDAVNAIGALAKDRSCDFVLVCGDVFESNHVDRQIIVRTLEALNNYQVPVYLVPGNHDPLDASSVYHFHSFENKKADHVYVVESSKAIEIAEHVLLIGAPWYSKQPLTDLVGQAYQGLVREDGVIRVVAGHGAVDTLSPDRDNPALIQVAEVDEAIRTGVVDYLALGDRHSLTQVGDSERIWYSGTPEPTDFDEIDPGKVLIVELEGTACSVEQFQIGSWRFVDKSFEISGPKDVQLLEAWFNDQPSKDRTVVRLALMGTVSIAQRAQLDAFLDHFRDLFAAIQLWHRHTNLAVIPEDHDFSDLSLTGFAGSAVGELRDMAASGGENAEEAQGALALLYRLAQGGS